VARYTSAGGLAKAFGIGLDVPVILTGTAKDRPLERWWSLGAQRRDAIRALRSLGVTLVTTPNFSLFIDQPRWDDLHSQKRIMIVHEEFLSEGLRLPFMSTHVPNEMGTLDRVHRCAARSDPYRV
jgi:hypothetical protein